MNRPFNLVDDNVVHATDVDAKGFDEAHPLVQKQLLEILYRAIPTSQMTLIVGAWASFASYYGHVSTLWLVVWCGTVTLIALVRVLPARHHLRLGIDAADCPHLFFLV